VSSTTGGATAGGVTGRRGPAAWGAWYEVAAVVVAWNVAVAQPLLDLLGRNPEFFVARRSTRLDVVLLGVAVTVVAPLLLGGVIALVRRAHSPTARVLFLLALAGLGALFGSRLVTEVGTPPTAVALVLAVLVGVATAVLFVRSAAVRSWFGFLWPVCALFLALFLLVSPVSKLVFPSQVASASGATIGNPVPVVFLVFDEFALASLLDERGEIDAAAFPSFARLAATSTWFRNAISVHNQTSHAVPVVLTGEQPRQGLLPTLADHPRNVFTLLGGAYEVRAIESVTQMCPGATCEVGTRREPFRRRMRSLARDLSIVYRHQVLPEGLTRGLPPIDQGWGGFGDADAPGGTVDSDALDEREREIVEAGATQDRAAASTAFVEQVARPASGARPTLDFLHVLLPHTPWQYLPDGTTYTAGVWGLSGERWADDDWATLVGYQRHLLQAQYADARLGDVLDALESSGRLDESLVVVTADHGVSFEPGLSRRDSEPGNLDGIAPVPFFVKVPRQHDGTIDDRPVETVDAVPTIADVLDVGSGYALDGTSALDDAGRTERRVYDKRFETLEYGLTTAPLLDAVARKWERFPSGGAGPVGYYAVGPDGAVVGRRVADLATGPRGEWRVALDDAGRYDGVDPASGAPLPVAVTGSIEGGSDGARADLWLAIAVNGEVAGLARPFTAVEDGPGFAGIVRPGAFVAGQNVVEVYVVEHDGATVRLVPT
jgi:hypothetical protein